MVVISGNYTPLGTDTFALVDAGSATITGNFTSLASGASLSNVLSSGRSGTLTYGSTVLVTMHRSTPTITWSNPSAITYGTALSSTQLNASSGGVLGTFTYSPNTGAVLGAGSQTLHVAFTPTDTDN